MRRVYMGGQNPCRASLSEEERDSTLSSLIEGETLCRATAYL